LAFCACSQSLLMLRYRSEMHMSQPGFGRGPADGRAFMKLLLPRPKGVFH
jgi:hypothetical protein